MTAGCMCGNPKPVPSNTCDTKHCENCGAWIFDEDYYNSIREKEREIKAVEALEREKIRQKYIPRKKKK